MENAEGLGAGGMSLLQSRKRDGRIFSASFSALDFGGYVCRYHVEQEQGDLFTRGIVLLDATQIFASKEEAEKACEIFINEGRAK